MLTMLPTSRLDGELPELKASDSTHELEFDQYSRLPQVKIDPAQSKLSYPGQGTKEDPYVIDWDLADVQNPYNWGYVRKWVITAQVPISQCWLGGKRLTS